MTPTGCVLQAFAQHHVAAALAVHRPGRGEAFQAGGEISRVGERVGMQFRIAAGQPSDIGIVRRRFVGERRERQDLGAGLAPCIDHVRIDKAESLVARERDPLPGRRQRQSSVGSCADVEKSGAGDNGVDIEITLGGVGETIDQGREVSMFAGLNESEMTLRQSKRGVARQRAEDRNVEPGDGVGDQRAMTFAADPIEDDSGDALRRLPIHRTIP